VNLARTRWDSALRWRHGIRPRVVVAYVALLAAALLVANVVVRQALLNRLDRTVEAALTQEAEELRRLVDGTDPATGEPFGDDVEALFDTFLRRNVPSDSEAFYTLVGDEPFLTSFEPPAPLLSDPSVLERVRGVTAPRRFHADTAAGEARVLAVPLLAGDGDGDDEVLGTFVVAFFLADERGEVDQATTLVALVSGVVLLASSVVAWILAGRVLRPVAQLTSTAARITETDLSVRIPVEGEDELARLGRTVNSMLDRLESAVTTQRQFLNDIAHDLRTQLTIVKGHLEVLSDDPGERAETLTLVHDELERMGRYVSDLLVLAKAEQHDFLRLGLVDLGEWTNELHAKARQLGGDRIVLGASPRPGTVVAEVDEDRLTQAVLNLVVNAVQHTDPDDEVRLEVGVDGDHLTVMVADSGRGIDPDLLPHLFDRATRGDQSRARRREGTGLGLAIVWAIVDAHGGRITAESSPGVGAIFTIELPLDPAGQIGLEEEACHES
jgi:two-component system, OmpR family, sensor kinase